MLYEHFRNYGCRLHMDYFYKNLRVAVLENEYLRVSVLIDKGTDIFEFLYKPKDMDFMWLSPWGINSPANLSLQFQPVRVISWIITREDGRKYCLILVMGANIMAQ